MKLAVISPPRYLHLTASMGYQMALGQYLIGDPQYRLHYKGMADWGAYVIVDNGTAEGVSIPFEEVFKVAMYIGATEVVLPDIWMDAERTIQRTRTYAAMVPYRMRMVCPQGQNVDEWMECLMELSKALDFKSIGIPKHLEGNGGRVEALSRIQEAGLHRKYDIHLLGCYALPLSEVYYALGAYPWIQGIDTGAPIAYAQMGKPIDTIEHHSLQWDGPVSDEELVMRNIEMMLEACNAYRHSGAERER